MYCTIRASRRRTITPTPPRIAAVEGSIDCTGISVWSLEFGVWSSEAQGRLTVTLTITLTPISHPFGPCVAIDRNLVFLRGFYREEFLLPLIVLAKVSQKLGNPSQELQFQLVDLELFRGRSEMQLQTWL